MIITGCPRSGTMSMAEVFGIQYEVQFTTNVDWPTLSKITIRLRSEASWMATPFISEFKNVIHLVRHPLKVINSLIGIEFWTDTAHEAYRIFAEKFCAVKGTPLEKSMMMWVKWNKSLNGYPRIRLEDFKNIPKMNSRKQSIIKTWNDLPDGEWKEKVRDLAEDYGYDNPSQ